MAARRREVTGGWKAALGASAVLAAGAGPLAAPAAGATALPIERASATAVAILSPAGRALGGTPTLFVADPAPAAHGYRFPHDGSLLRIGDVIASAERGRGDTVEATGSVVLRSVELFGGTLQIDVLRTRASLSATGGAVTDASATHLVRVRLDGDPVELVPGQKLWVKGWGYAVVDDPATHTGPADAGDTLAGLRLHLTSAHAGLPAGTDIVLGRAHADLQHVPPAVAGDPGGSGSGDGGSTGTVPDRQGKVQGTHRHHRTRTPKPARRHRRHAPQPPAPVHHPATPPLRAAQGTGARAAVVRAALAQVGWPYVWGGESRLEGGFDCSGLVDHAYSRAGYPLPGRPTADVLWAMSVPVRQADLRPGDLVLLGVSSGYVHHVGLYAGDGWVIAAPHRGALVSIQPLSAVPWDGFGRILQAPRGRILTARLAVGRDGRVVPRPRHVAATTATAASPPAPAPAALTTPVPRRSASPPAPSKRRHRPDRLAAVPREEFRHWSVKLLASFRGAGR